MLERETKPGWLRSSGATLTCCWLRREELFINNSGGCGSGGARRRSGLAPRSPASRPRAPRRAAAERAVPAALPSAPAAPGRFGPCYTRMGQTQPQPRPPAAGINGPRTRDRHKSTRTLVTRRGQHLVPPSHHPLPFPVPPWAQTLVPFPSQTDPILNPFLIPPNPRLPNPS